MHTRDVSSADISPADALQFLKEGNFRFVTALHQPRDLLDQMEKTKEGQTPFAAIVSCMDSRTSVELVFDQGFGAVFSIRNAGNVVGTTVLGSLEYAAAVVGVKLIVILGHTGCGAIRGAIDGVKLGHLTALLENICSPAESAGWRMVHADGTSCNAALVAQVTERNVRRGVARVLEQSPAIRALVEEEQLGIVPAVYDIATGRIRFHDTPADAPGVAPTARKRQPQGLESD
ncbi:carbonic anhydrase [Xylophilus sp. GOD-11R]|uniref:carbonic anhydrase n=1 Tax=Xylophilus sp. GOD-11R TaxID=3089814 RepID=UPI00298C8AFC|nr:carbonic anhydrase [Xylophilus sp. GOD-11R]WPB56177.1 carbonic anhydrase [Xylophilus sp. GOD-11R]